MITDFSVFNLLIYAAGIGFAFAIVFTNIQRTAYSRFIAYLLDNSIICEDNAVTLDEADLSFFQRKIITNAITKHHGFRRSVACIKSEIDEGDELFNKKDTTKYYIIDNDHVALKKKYSFKTMSGITVLLLIIILAITVIITSAFAGYIIKKASAPKIENEIQLEEDKGKTENAQNIDVLPEIESSEDENADTEQDEQNQDFAGPRIPV